MTLALPLQHLVMSESRVQTTYILCQQINLFGPFVLMCLAPPGIWSIFDWLQFASCRVSFCILSRPPPCWLLAVKLKGLPVISARPIWDKSPSADLKISSLGNISLQTSFRTYHLQDFDLQAVYKCCLALISAGPLRDKCLGAGDIQPAIMFANTF